MTNMFNTSVNDNLLTSCAEMENSESSLDKFRLDHTGEDHDQHQINKNDNKSGSFESSLASSFSEASSTMDSAIMSLPCMMLSTERIHLEQWKWSYRGEGAANLVISLQDTKGTRKIARFSKSKYKDKDNNAKIDEKAFYANSVMGPLLGGRFVRPVTVGIMDEHDFETVKMEAQPFRPLARCKKNIRSRKVILSPDCVFLDDNHRTNTFGDTLSIEVKPKLGYHEGYPKLCTRCLKQEAKLQEGDIDCISKYCPLDLFSGDLGRMKRALFDLYESPHNRFKVFKNGKLIYTETTGHKDQLEEILSQFFQREEGINTLASLLCSALLGQTQIKPELLNLLPSKKNSSQCDSKSKPLPKDCILNILLNLQKLGMEIDDITAEALSDKMMSEIKSQEELHDLTIWYPLLTSNKKDSEKILEEQLGHSRRFIEDLQKLQKFLLSVTAKDVSILLTFRAIQDCETEENLPSISLPGTGNTAAESGLFAGSHPDFSGGNNQTKLRTMISVIDLDPKPVHRIPTWIEKRQDWLKSYLKN